VKISVIFSYRNHRMILLVVTNMIWNILGLFPIYSDVTDVNISHQSLERKTTNTILSSK